MSGRTIKRLRRACFGPDMATGASSREYGEVNVTRRHYQDDEGKTKATLITGTIVVTSPRHRVFKRAKRLYRTMMHIRDGEARRRAALTLAAAQVEAEVSKKRKRRKEAK